MLSKISAPAKLFTLAIVLALVGCTVACRNRNATEQATPVRSQSQRPSVKANSEMGWVLNDGKREKLADYQGKVLVVDFYATWCEPCRKSIPHLTTLQKDYWRQGLQVIGLNVGGPDDRIKVGAFAKQLDIQYLLGFPDKALTDLFLSDDQTIPQTFVFGRDGQLVKRFIGYEDSTALELERIIHMETAKQ